jgi:hypothetical protein
MNDTEMLLRIAGNSKRRPAADDARLGFAGQHPRRMEHGYMSAAELRRNRKRRRRDPAVDRAGCWLPPAYGRDVATRYGGRVPAVHALMGFVAGCLGFAARSSRRSPQQCPQPILAHRSETRQCPGISFQARAMDGKARKRPAWSAYIRSVTRMPFAAVGSAIRPLPRGPEYLGVCGEPTRAGRRWWGAGIHAASRKRRFQLGRIGQGFDAAKERFTKPPQRVRERMRARLLNPMVKA